jgi:hypothetical protein
MQLGAIFFIIPWKALCMFRVLFRPTIRSVLKLYMQLLVQSCIGMVSDPVCYKMISSRERTALRHDQIRPDLTPYRYTIVPITACTVLRHS